MPFVSSGPTPSFINTSGQRLLFGRLAGTLPQLPVGGLANDGDVTLSASGVFAGGSFNQNTNRAGQTAALTGNTFVNISGGTQGAFSVASTVAGTPNVGDYLCAPGVPQRTTIASIGSAIGSLACTTNTTTTVSTASTAALVVGAAISGTNIPANSYIVSIVNSTQFTIPSAATGSGSVNLAIAKCLVLSAPCAFLSGSTVIIGNTAAASNVPSRYCDAPMFPVSAISSDGKTLTVNSGTGACGNLWDIWAQDPLLIINLQGDSSHSGNVGNWELNRAAATSFVTRTDISNGTIVLDQPLQKLYGQTTDNTVLSGQKVVVIRVPQYGNLTLSAGLSYTAHAWDGTIGGCVALQAQSTTQTSSSPITAVGLGYRAGTVAGAVGEGYKGGYNTVSVSAVGSGGGGGDFTNSKSTANSPGSAGTNGNATGGGGGGGGGGAGGGAGGGGGYAATGGSGGTNVSSLGGGGGAAGAGPNAATSGNAGVIGSGPGFGGTPGTGNVTNGGGGAGGNGLGGASASAAGGGASCGTAALGAVFLGGAGGNASTGFQGWTGGRGGNSSNSSTAPGNGGGGGGGGGGYAGGTAGAGGSAGTGNGFTGSGGSPGATGGAGGQGGRGAGAIFLWAKQSTLLYLIAQGSNATVGGAGGAGGNSVPGVNATTAEYGGAGGGGAGGGGGGGGAGGSIYATVINLVSAATTDAAYTIGGSGGNPGSGGAGGVDQGGNTGLSGGAGVGIAALVGGSGSAGRTRFNTFTSGGIYTSTIADGAGNFTSSNPSGYKSNL